MVIGDYTASADNGITFLADSAGSSTIGFTDDTHSSLRGGIQYSHSGDSMRFTTFTSERMRIDSSGNLLVGTTDNNATLAAGTADGVAIGTGSYSTIANNGRCLILNRHTSDGNILELNKNGTIVGSISTYSSNVLIGTGTTGVRFYDSTPSVLPRNPTTGANADDTIDFGSSGSRYKDLYLSGGVYLGGTGSANKLEDYEEGTWTPVVKQGGCSVTTVHKAVYVKIGKSVTVTTYLTIGSGGTGTRFELEGLPFNSESYGYACGSADGGTGNGVSIVRTQSNSDYLRFKRVASPNDWAVGSAMDNEHLIFALTYFT